MTRPALIKTNSDDIVVQRLQTNLDNIFAYVLRPDLMDGTPVKSVVITANQDIAVSHGLGREYSGFLITLKNNFGDIKVSDTTNNSKNKQIILQSNASMVADLWIF